jgi:hypothetical protein
VNRELSDTVFTNDTLIERHCSMYTVTLLVVTHPTRYDIQGGSLNIHHGWVRFDLASKWAEVERIDKNDFEKRGK